MYICIYTILQLYFQFSKYYILMYMIYDMYICNICINLHKIINVILHIPHYVPFMSIFIFHCCFVSSWNFKDYVLYHISYIQIHYIIISLCNIQFSIISNNLNGFLADLDHIPISSCFFVVCSSNYCNSYIYIYYSFRSLSPILPILSYFHTIILVYFLTGKNCAHCPMFVAKASCQAVAALHACVGPWVRVANNI